MPEKRAKPKRAKTVRAWAIVWLQGQEIVTYQIHHSFDEAREAKARAAVPVRIARVEIREVTR